ncbi:DUF5133 domain-containing protein [Actinacidiphila rubida]|uniref:DUF5133 domain-containing protein n=1 Tax=Actinacidiphila rubida TaxID=310780 RepID=A0A1H8TZW0_9ACTN|nr:DUF5133 domain-containing protein [Actinacidiphila rubida]SEO96336.1 protein of unknown function [Actinacidiphila rubida]
MLMAHPTVLRTLVERYERLSALSGRRGAETADGGDGTASEVRRQLLDTVYTLCVSTGTREVGPALVAARAHIERHTFAEPEVLGGSAA